MKRRNQWFLITCIAIFIILIFITPSYGWQIRNWLEGRKNGESETALTAENEALKAQLAQLQGIAAQLPTSSADYLRAMVYSRYPFNFKNEILVNIGSSEGVSNNKAVIFRGVLIGTVRDVFDHSSLVTTIFDNSFKLPVRIGSHGYDALFLGGSSPIVASISKTANISPGDIVYSAGAGIEYGLPIALIATTSTSKDDLFQEASLNFAYDINSIQTVLVEK